MAELLVNEPDNEPMAEREFWLGDCFIQPQLNRISRGTESFQIEPKIMRVLLCLAGRAGQLVTRDQLLSAVWGDVFVSEQVLSRSISELRKVLADDARSQTVIETIPKTGYRLIASIQTKPPQTDTTPEDISAPIAPSTNDSLPTPAEPLSAFVSAIAAKPVSPLQGRGVLALALLLCAAAILLAVWLWLRPAKSLPDTTMRLSLELSEAIPPELDLFQTFRLSPDGRRLVHVGRREGRYQLFMRTLDQLESTPIPGTEGGVGPFFSPDGQWLGFFAAGVLKKVALSGGAPTLIGGPADDPLGASWGEDGQIVFVRRYFDGLFRIPATGGKAQAITSLDWQRGERSHFWPEVLPGSEAVLFTIWHGGGSGDADIAAVSLKTGEKKTLITGATRARYLSSGHLLYASRGSLRLVPFDVRRLAIQGQPTILLEKVAVSQISGAAHFDCTQTGLLLYLPQQARQTDRRLIWVDRQGQTTAITEKAQHYWTPRLAPDGERLAFGLLNEGSDLWSYELAAGAFKRLTFAGTSLAPLWTLDGRRVIYTSDQNGSPLNLYWKAADGSDNGERLTQSNNIQFPGSVTPDGNTLIFWEVDSATRCDVWRLDLRAPAAERNPQPLLRTDADEAQPVLSPDGRWLAYTVKDTGQWQVFVQSFPDLHGKWQISTEGGIEPVWARSGRELFYRAGDKILSVAIDSSAGFKASSPRVVVAGQSRLETVTLLPTFDVSSDGQRFVLIKSEQEQSPTRLNIVVNWSSELQQ